MNLLILGAAGRTGSALVEQAIARGHTVTAFVHTADTSLPAGIRIMEGDARDHTAILAAVRGQDAVIDALGGHLPFLETTIETDTARNVIAAMTEAGVRRLLVISTIGEGDSTGNVHDFYKHFIMPTLLRGVMKDKAGLEAAVERSQLDWTIVRAAGLRTGESKGVRIVRPDSGEKVRFINRADVAAFLLDQLTSTEFLHQVVGIANPDEVTAPKPA